LLSQKEAFGPPLWSPDGQTILFQPLGGDLTLISLSDGRSRQITGTRLARTYAWAPRRRTIAYVVRDDIFLVEADGGTPEPVASSEAPDDIAWSPDGTRIAFTSQRLGEGTHAWVLRLAARTLTRLTSARACDGAPSWSPDSSAITLGRWECGPRSNVGLYRVNANGGGERRLAKGDPWMTPTRASWDPLGRPVPPKPRLAPPSYLTWIYGRRGRRAGFVVRKF